MNFRDVELLQNAIQNSGQDALKRRQMSNQQQQEMERLALEKSFRDAQMQHYTNVEANQRQAAEKAAQREADRLALEDKRLTQQADFNKLKLGEAQKTDVFNRLNQIYTNTVNGVKEGIVEAPLANEIISGMIKSFKDDYPDLASDARFATIQDAYTKNPFIDKAEKPEKEQFDTMTEEYIVPKVPEKAAVWEGEWNPFVENKEISPAVPAIPEKKVKIERKIPRNGNMSAGLKQAQGNGSNAESDKKVLTTEIAASYLKKAGNRKDAEALAKADGYSW